MTEYRCCLRAYGLILEADHAVIMAALRSSRMLFSPAPRPAIDTDFRFFSEQRDNTLPVPVAEALHQAGIYYEWTARSRAWENYRTLRGLFFDAQSGVSVRFVEHDASSGRPEIIPGTSEDIALSSKILSRMPALEEEQPLMRASNMHEALTFMEDPRLAPGLAQYCLERRAQNLAQTSFSAQQSTA